MDKKHLEKASVDGQRFETKNEFKMYPDLAFVFHMSITTQQSCYISDKNITFSFQFHCVGHWFSNFPRPNIYYQIWILIPSHHNKVPSIYSALSKLASLWVQPCGLYEPHNAIFWLISCNISVVKINHADIRPLLVPLTFGDLWKDAAMCSI